MILKFLTRLMVRRKFNRAADAVKQFIESSWRGMHFRSKVGVYLTNVRLLSLRCNRFNATFSMFDIKHEHQCPTKTKKPRVHNHATKQPTTQRRSIFPWEFDDEGRDLFEQLTAFASTASSISMPRTCGNWKLNCWETFLQIFRLSFHCSLGGWFKAPHQPGGYKPTEDGGEFNPKKVEVKAPRLTQPGLCR